MHNRDLILKFVYIKEKVNFIAYFIIGEDKPTKVKSQIQEVPHVMGYHIITDIFIIVVLFVKYTDSNLHS